MNTSRLFRAGLLVVAAVATMGFDQNWIATIEQGDVSHTIGNPEAETTLTEYVSYTCPACGNFARRGEETVKLAYVAPGTTKLEIRHIQRNVVDIAVTMAAWCGSSDQFLRRHSGIMWKQDEWLNKAAGTSPAQQQRWFTGTGAQRRRAIANDIDLHDIMSTYGIGRAELDRCLADDAFADKLVASSSADLNDRGVKGTPSFDLDGELLDHVHTWADLAPKLNDRIAAAKEQ